MRLIKIVTSVTCALAILASPAFAGEKTCCEKASAEGKECTHKCCVTAHKDGKSCEKCNPSKEDLKLKKKSKKAEKATSKES
jgi:hypothetical protein